MSILCCVFASSYETPHIPVDFAAHCHHHCCLFVVIFATLKLKSYFVIINYDDTMIFGIIKKVTIARFKALSTVSLFDFPHITQPHGRASCCLPRAKYPLCSRACYTRDPHRQQSPHRKIMVRDFFN